jgi:hypothetical protein
MQRVFAICWLTWKAAFRFRLFLVISVLLLGAVVGLPLLLKDDGTAQGFTQILLTYTLTTITALLGFSTLWLACGTLARDIEECQMQVVTVKPIARWQVWLGKWLGLMSLNACLLALTGTCLFVLMQYRATKLPPEERTKLRNEVLVARAGIREASREDWIRGETDKRLRERLEKNPVTQADLPEVRKQILEQVRADEQVIPPNYVRPWKIDFSWVSKSAREQPLYLRIKFNSADKSPSGTFGGVWYFGEPKKTKVWRTDVMSLAPDTFHEFEVPPGLIDDQGILTVIFHNVNETALLFPLEDGLEVLYREGGFGLNFVRGLGIIYCWIGLLTTLGLAAASFLSFPVAAFLSLGVLAISLSSGTLAGAIEEGTLGNYNAEKGIKGHTPVDFFAIPTFRAVLKIINMAKDFSPIDSLSTGRSITWTQLSLAFCQIILVLGGILAAIGIGTFHRRELATAQGTQ